MRLVPLSEVINLDIGEKVPSTKGKLKSVFDIKTGENDNGTWSLQSIVLTDGPVEMRVKIWGHDVIPKSWRGKTVYISSKQGEKGLTGVSVIQDTYKWTQGQPIKKNLEVKEGAEVSLTEADAGASDSTPATKPQAAASSTPPSHAPTPSAPATAAKAPVPVDPISAGRDQIIRAKRFIAREMNGYELVVRAVRHLGKKLHDEGTPLTEEHLEKICASLFITATRDGCFNELPYDDLAKYDAKKQDAPKAS